jgi:signal transduction histidine kinase
VTVSLRRSQIDQSPGFVEVSVKDQGTGIPPEAQARLFERFYRVPHVVGSETRGVGLGLYIVANLVHQHGGKIYVESSGVPGEGSCFRFTLPELTISSEGEG